MTQHIENCDAKFLGDPDLTTAQLPHFFLSRDDLDLILSFWRLPIFDGSTVHNDTDGDGDFAFKVVEKRLRLQYNLGSGVFTIFSREVGLDGKDKIFHRKIFQGIDLGRLALCCG